MSKRLTVTCNNFILEAKSLLSMLSLVRKTMEQQILIRRDVLESSVSRASHSVRTSGRENSCDNIRLSHLESEVTGHSRSEIHLLLTPALFMPKRRSSRHPKTTTGGISCFSLYLNGIRRAPKESIMGRLKTGLGNMKI